MKKLALLSALSFSLFTNAQSPVVEGTYLPVAGTSIKQIWNTNGGISIVPTAGPNQVWDYANQFTNPKDTFQIKTYYKNQVPHNQYFPNATHATFLRMPASTGGAPFSDVGDSLWTFLKIDTVGVHNVGSFSDKKKYDTTITMTRTELITPATGAYNMADIFDTSRYVVYTKYLGNNVMVHGTKYKHMLPYGYGSLKLPNGNYNDVLLVKEFTKTIDSVFVKVGANYVFNPLLQPTVNNSIAYYFVRNNTFGSSYLMWLNADAANTFIGQGWYTLPIDFGKIEGRVFVDNASNSAVPVTNGSAYLYRENSNFSKNVILDTSAIDMNGNYAFDSIPYGRYRVAARPNVNDYPNSMITYYGDTTDWLTASEINTLINRKDTAGNDIRLKYHAAATGLGQISGTLGEDFNYGRTIGGNTTQATKQIPGVGITVRKRPAGSNARQMRTTVVVNTHSFSISNLEDGDYYLLADIPGLYQADTCNFTISGGTVITNLNFISGKDSIHQLCNIVIASKPTVSKITTGLKAYPNPFTNQTQIELALAKASNINLSVYNTLGAKVSTLFNGSKAEGKYSFNFNAHANELPAGIYFVKLSLDNQVEVLKVIME